MQARHFGPIIAVLKTWSYAATPPVATSCISSTSSSTPPYISFSLLLLAALPPSPSPLQHPTARILRTPTFFCLVNVGKQRKIKCSARRKNANHEQAHRIHKNNYADT